VSSIPQRLLQFNLHVWQLSTGHAPFHEIKNQNAAVLKIINAQRPSRPTDGDICGTLVSDALWAMVESCWAQDAFIRPTAAAVVSQLAAMAADVLSEDLIEHLETRICNGVAVQTALDILDRVRAHIKKHINLMHQRA
jgi:hypothetical protein